MPQSINILFFAALADKLGCQNEKITLPKEVSTANQLRSLLSARQGTWSALEDENIRCAVNQEIIKGDHPIKAGDEVAFFPPVTGG